MQVRNIQSHGYVISTHKKHAIQLNKNKNLVKDSFQYSTNKKDTVSFKSSRFFNEPIGYGYENGPDRIAYLKEDGSFEYARKHPDGSTESVQYDVEKQEETKIAMDKQYFYMVRTNPSEQERIRRERSTGEIVYHRYENLSGDFTEEEHDKKLGRYIHKQKVDDIIAVKVTNEQGEIVTSGPLTWDRGKKDASTKMIITRNMVTKKVVKKESYDPDNKYMSLHDEETGQIIHEEYTDRNSGNNFVIDYYANSKPSRIQKTNPSKTQTEDIHYDQEGSETQHTIFINRADLKGKQVIIPNTKITQVANYEFKDEKTGEIKSREDLYRQNPNTVYQTTIKSKFTGKILEETEFYEDGTPKKVVEYIEDGKRRETSFDKNHQQTLLSVLTSRGFEIFHVEYNVENGGFSKRIIQDPITKQKEEYTYDESGKKISEHKFYNGNGDLYEHAIYYKVPNKPQIIYEYSNNYCRISKYRRLTNGLSEPQRIVPVEKAQVPQTNADSDDSNFIDKFQVFHSN